MNLKYLSPGQWNPAIMVVSFRVFKKASPNGKLTSYLGRRDFVDHVSETDPIDGVLLVDKDYLGGRQIYAQLVCSFRYGREEDETMGLNFKKELTLADEQIYPPSQHNPNVSRLQERLLKKLGSTAFPFNLTFPRHSPTSVTLEPQNGGEGTPCGVEYFVRCYVLDTDKDKSHRRSAVSLAIRKIQYAPTKPGRQPCTVVRKDFMFSPGELELEATLDRQLYHHGDTISINVCIKNHSNKAVKKIAVSILQCIDIAMFTGGHCKARIASVETTEGCPVEPGSSMQKVIKLVPSLKNLRDRSGIALDGRLRGEDTDLASSTLLADENSRDIFGMVISYTTKVKLFLGAIGGELAAELPFVLMHPKPNMKRIIKADTLAEVEGFSASLDDPNYDPTNDMGKASLQDKCD
eukprot:maker-scaffold22_size673200-snap-gene-2.19 protein:Tk12672 transcript:maker-scaffold22_size673200-snap-gene-2.19-mRNA-1 annotation:"arrestin1 precursor"